MKEQTKKKNFISCLLSMSMVGSPATLEAQGTQEELLKSCPLYLNMWKAHIGAKNWSVGKEMALHISVNQKDHQLVWGSEEKIIHWICILILFAFVCGNADHGSCVYDRTFDHGKADRLAIGDALKRVSLGYFQKNSTDRTESA